MTLSSEVRKSNIFNDKLKMISVVILLVSVVFTTVALADDQPPVVEDYDGINNTAFRADTVESEEFRFNITDDDGVADKSLEITLNYSTSESTNYHTFDNDSYFEYNDSSTIYTFNPPDDWTVFDNIERAPEDNDTIYFSIYVADALEDSNEFNESRYLNIKVDGNGPQLLNTDPIDGSFTNDNQQLIEFNLSDSYGIDSSSIQVNVTDGVNDYLRNAGTGDDHVSWDDTNEVLSIDPSASDPFTFNDSSVYIEVSVDDDASHSSYFDLEFNVDTQAATNLTLDSPENALNVMENTVIDISYSYDEEHPSYTNVTLDDGSGNTATFNINDTYYAGNNTVKDVSIDLTDPDSTTGEGIIHDNSYDIVLKTVDRAGNVIEETKLTDGVNVFNLNFDSDYYNVGDTATILYYNETYQDKWSSRIDETTVTVENKAGTDSEEVTLTETEDDSGLLIGYLDLLNESTSVDDGKLSVTESDTINLTKEGLSGYRIANIDEEPPTNLAIEDPSETAYRSTLMSANNELTVNYSYTEIGSTERTVNITVHNDDNVLELNKDNPSTAEGDISNNYTINFTESNLTEGVYDLTLTVEDGAGNINNVTETDLVVIDDTNPTVTDDTIGPFQEVSESREISVQISDNNIIDTEEKFYLHYNVSGVRSDAVEMSLDGSSGTDVSYTGYINETGATNGTEIRYWVNGTDKASNVLLDANGIENDDTDPLGAYIIDGSGPEAPYNYHVDGVSCGIEVSWIEPNDPEGSEIVTHKIYTNESGAWRNVANRTGESYVSKLPVGTYHYRVSAVDSAGNEGNLTSIKSATADLGNIVLDFETRFDRIYEENDMIMTSRYLDARVHDECPVNGGDGNPIDGTSVSFSKNTNLDNVTLGDVSDVTDSEGTATVNLTAPLTYGLINITSDTEVSGETIVGKLRLQLEQHRLHLNRGWNLISFPIVPDNSSIESILNGMIDIDNLDYMWGFDPNSGEWKVYNPDKPSNDLEEMHVDRGYWIKMESADLLTVYGSLAETVEQDPDNIEEAIPDTIEYDDGWNMIGFRKWMDRAKFLEELGVDTVIEYNSIGEETGIYTSANVTDTEYGKGYWVELNESKSITAADLRKI